MQAENIKNSCTGLRITDLDGTEVIDCVEEISYLFASSINVISEDILDTNIFVGIDATYIKDMLYDCGLDSMRFSMSLSETEILELCLSLNKFSNKMVKKW